MIRRGYNLVLAVWDRVANRGPIGAYRKINGGDLAAMIAFNALFALIPMLLLLVSLAGFLLKDENRRASVVIHIANVLPYGQARETADTVLSASNQSAQLGIIGLVSLLWVGTSFITTVARAMDRVYGVQGRPYVHNRLVAAIVVIFVTILLITASITATLPAFVANDWMPDPLQRYFPMTTWTQLVSLGASVTMGMILFGMLNLVLPNAGQRPADVWPGTVFSALAFTLLTQAFPLYLQLATNLNRYGALFGVIWLLLAYFLFLAHIMVIGTLINAGFMRWRQQRGRRYAAPIG